MKKQLLAMAVLAGAASVTQADIIGASAGAYYWKQSWDGDVQSGPDSIDTKKDLGYDEDNGNKDDEDSTTVTHTHTRTR